MVEHRGHKRVECSRIGPHRPGRPLCDHGARLGREVGLGQLHQVVPWAKHRIACRRALLEEAAPACHNMGPQILGRQREEEDRRFQRVGLGQRGSHQVIASALAGCFQQHRVLAVEQLPQLGAFGRRLLLELGASGHGFGPPGERQLQRGFAAGENTIKRIIVGRGDRVVLVIVAAGAGHRQTQEAAGHGVDPVIDLVVNVAVKHPAEGQKPHGRQPPGLVLWGHDVGGELLVDEPIKRRIIVERSNHVVAIRVGKRANPIIAVHEHAILGVGIPGDVKPVPAPPFPIARRGQQAVDHAGEGVVERIALERFDLLGRGRQADQVVVGPAKQGAAISRRRRRQAAGLELRQHEARREGTSSQSFLATGGGSRRAIGW